MVGPKTVGRFVRLKARRGNCLFWFGLFMCIMLVKLSSVGYTVGVDMCSLACLVVCLCWCVDGKVKQRHRDKERKKQATPKFVDKSRTMFTEREYNTTRC